MLGIITYFVFDEPELWEELVRFLFKLGVADTSGVLGGSILGMVYLLLDIWEGEDTSSEVGFCSSGP